jgi:hypothetical protein
VEFDITDTDGFAYRPVAKLAARDWMVCTSSDSRSMYIGYRYVRYHPEIAARHELCVVWGVTGRDRLICEHRLRGNLFFGPWKIVTGFSALQPNQLLAPIELSYKWTAPLYEPKAVLESVEVSAHWSTFSYTPKFATNSCERDTSS